MQAFQVRNICFVLITILCLAGFSVVAYGQNGETAIVHANIDREWPSNDPEDGESWATAYRFLQDALDRANVLLTPPTPFDAVDIWVAAGVYKPDHDSNNPDGTCDEFGEFMECAGTAATFTIPSNVRVFGGFIGTESMLDERNGGVHDPTLTILTGDLADGAGKPDTPSFTYSAEVVTFENTDTTARLDTVTIEQGFTAARFNSADAILSNSIIRNNRTYGVWMNATGTEITSQPRIINCQFIDNGELAAHADSRAATVRGAVRQSAP